MMDLLARRDHSETEIRKKLRLKFTGDEIDRAIDYGKKHGWLPNSEEAIQALAHKTAESLHRKKKGMLYINKFLAEKGLPELGTDDQRELDKAQSLVENKISKLEGKTREEKDKAKAKIGRFLVARGYDLSTVRRVIYGKF